eukprot:CAMPEP_0118671876 /NCGR_PEP_ID=MMETSP0785-20121206/22237_1 /TAXON_ID=91992 /ORGANISM="Bolidomonas pacifica, Strain CCMP 1866" /LENGTH=114 /DNA_ID=CAMNT_0006566793 /DNA_START=458 /DNA_END=802 /DNA_ORIENTATION=+
MTPPPSWPNPGSAIRTLSGQPRTFSSVKALVQYATQLQKYVGGETGEVNPSNNADNLDSDEATHERENSFSFTSKKEESKGRKFIAAYRDVSWPVRGSGKSKKDILLSHTISPA